MSRALYVVQAGFLSLLLNASVYAQNIQEQINQEVVKNLDWLTRGPITVIVWLIVLGGLLGAFKSRSAGNVGWAFGVMIVWMIILAIAGSVK